MNGISIGITVLCMLFFGWVYLRYTPVYGNKILPFKGIATLMAVLLAFISAGNLGSTGRWLIFVALIVCAVADIVLELNTTLGIVTFLVAQILLITGYLNFTGFKWYTFVLWILILAIFVFGYGKLLNEQKSLAVYASVYSLALSLMCAMGLTVAIVIGSVGAICLAVGGCLFFISDFILAGTFVNKYSKEKAHWIVLILYYAAVLCIAVGGYYM